MLNAQCSMLNAKCEMPKRAGLTHQSDEDGALSPSSQLGLFAFRIEHFALSMIIRTLSR
jgi:hypothetical protein